VSSSGGKPKLIGCLRKTGDTRPLSPIIKKDSKPVTWGQPFAANAPWVVGISQHEGGETASYSVTTFQIGHEISGTSSACHLGGGGSRENANEVTKLVITPQGDVAWSGTELFLNKDGQEVRGPEVNVCIHGHIGGYNHGKSQNIDFGDGIAVGSLRLRGTTLTWMDNGSECRTKLEDLKSLTISGCVPYQSDGRPR
jgi:hypothetical protein